MVTVQQLHCLQPAPEAFRLYSSYTNDHLLQRPVGLTSQSLAEKTNTDGPMGNHYVRSGAAAPGFWLL